MWNQLPVRKQLLQFGAGFQQRLSRREKRIHNTKDEHVEHQDFHLMLCKIRGRAADIGGPWTVLRLIGAK